MYDHKSIEAKWQKYWEGNKTFKCDIDDKKEKHYVLDMFPYPSGVGLHVGHPEGYTATDIISRYLRMNGKNVLHPMGWDAFGLPAENYAIKTKVHPKKTTDKSIGIFRKQIKTIGFSYDWNREINTASPDYYKWTQWFFLFLYKNGLAYKKKAPVNWCESCKTTLANEQVIHGVCERCKNKVIQKNLEQWFFKITDFIEDTEYEGRKTDGLLTGLDKIDWPSSTKISQRNWIGRKEWIDISYPVDGTDEEIIVSTTRPDTNFGATFVVIAPEHPIWQKKELIPEKHRSEVEKYIEKSLCKTELERISEEKKKTGVFSGLYCVNQLNDTKMPIYVTDFVLMTVGTGAVVGVPGHDMRDFKFAQNFDLPVIRVVVGSNGDKSPITKTEQVQEEEGTMINSEFLNGLDIHDATKKIMNYLEEKGWGKRTTRYHLRDWLVSRQRYWGAPIPIIHCENCGEVPDENLPVLLPEDVDFLPTGESPLKFSKTFHDIKCPKCGGDKIRREVDTMDTFVCSSWYFFRFADPKNDEVFADKDILKHFLPVDLYVGGAEHTVLHLLYSRFFTKALHRHGYIDFDEPFLKLRHQGIILGEDSEKMSKSRGNVINPDEVIQKYGADTLRLYEMFMGDFAHSKPWSTKNIEGVYKFLQRVWRLFEQEKIFDEEPDEKTVRMTHRSIKKVTYDIENFGFNTAISQLMIFTNHLYKTEKVSKKVFKILVLLLSPFAPHLSEELWENLGHTEPLAYEPWPKYDESLVQEEEIELVVQVNGKVREKLRVSKDITKEEVISRAKILPKIKKYLEEGELKKEIFVPGKLINLVVG